MYQVQNSVKAIDQYILNKKKVLSNSGRTDTVVYGETAFNTIKDLLENTEVLENGCLVETPFLVAIKQALVIGINQIYKEREALLLSSTKISSLAYHYCIKFGKHKQMLQIIYELGDISFILAYYKNIEQIACLRDEILNASNPMYAYLFCLEISDDADMRQIIIDSDEPKWALNYCKEIKIDADMRQVVLDTGSPEWAYYYYSAVSNDAEMRQIILDAGEPEWVNKLAS